MDSSYAGKNIEFHLDSVTGTKIGTLTVQSTGGWSTFKSQSASISGASGIHDLYLTFSRGSGPQSDGIANIDSFVFSQSSSGTSAFSTIQATSYSAQSGLTGNATYIGSLDSGDYAKYSAVNFSSATAASVNVSVAVDNAYAGKQIEFRLDSPTGTRIGALTVQGTGGWTAFSTAECLDQRRQRHARSLSRRGGWGTEWATSPPSRFRPRR